MPRSSKLTKPKIIEYIKNNLKDTNSSILDCGPGVGTYSMLLSKKRKRIYENMDCCEIFEPYSKWYNLEKKYRNVFISNICNFQFDWYDMIIMGDVLEHIKIKKAQNLLKNIYNKCKHLLVIIPYLYKQGALKGNIYETHRQPDLTHKIFMKRYPKFKREFKLCNVGMYIKE